MTEAGKHKEYTEAHLPVCAKEVRIVHEADGQFAAYWNEHRAVVRVCRCFPWSDPQRHISLRDDKDREIAFFKDLSEVGTESRPVLEQALAEAGFVLEITRVDAVEEEFEIRNWKVHTRQGPRTFQTKRDEWPEPVRSGGFLVQDVAGDLFHIPDPGTLDPASRNFLRALID